ncbi:hypothetical protein ABBQ32_003500 [Trebouxia sp. C0010 RCD-2024]
MFEIACWRSIELCKPTSINQSLMFPSLAKLWLSETPSDHDVIRLITHLDTAGTLLDSVYWCLTPHAWGALNSLTW